MELSIQNQIFLQNLEIEKTLRHILVLLQNL